MFLVCIGTIDNLIVSQRHIIHKRDMMVINDRVIFHHFFRSRDYCTWNRES